MAGKIAKLVQPDRSKIHVHDPVEIKYWLRHFQVSPDILHAAIAKVGNSVAAVRKELAVTQSIPDD